MSPLYLDGFLRLRDPQLVIASHGESRSQSLPTYSVCAYDIQIDDSPWIYLRNNLCPTGELVPITCIVHPVGDAMSFFVFYNDSSTAVASAFSFDLGSMVTS